MILRDSHSVFFRQARLATYPIPTIMPDVTWTNQNQPALAVPVDQTTDFSSFATQAIFQGIVLKADQFRFSLGRRAVVSAMPVIMPQTGFLPMSFRTLLPGRAYRFLYPSINFKCLPQKLNERRMLVTRIRDTESEPLEEETLASNPFIKRGRWLVTGTDLDKIDERSFYLESMVEVTDVTTHLPQSMIQDLSRSQHQSVQRRQLTDDSGQSLKIHQSCHHVVHDIMPVRADLRSPVLEDGSIPSRQFRCSCTAHDDANSSSGQP